MTIGTKIYTAFFGKAVGSDEFGNKYYISKSAKKARRWVVYNGIAEASKVPASWHGWLHKTVDNPPVGTETIHSWQKPHLPNLTGTEFAYVPDGHISKSSKRAAATGDYVAWNPNSN